MKTALCSECHGNDVVYRYWRNDKEQQVLSDWLYCRECNPNAYGHWPLLGEDWTEIGSDQFEILRRSGYMDVSE